MLILYIWLGGTVLLLSIALTVFEKVGEKMSDEAIWLYTLIAFFWPICLIGGLGHSHYHSYKARRLFKKGCVRQ